MPLTLPQFLCTSICDHWVHYKFDQNQTNNPEGVVFLVNCEQTTDDDRRQARTMTDDGISSSSLRPDELKTKVGFTSKTELLSYNIPFVQAMNNDYS